MIQAEDFYSLNEDVAAAAAAATAAAEGRDGQDLADVNKVTALATSYLPSYN